jgi:hypothetical protein
MAHDWILCSEAILYCVWNVMAHAQKPDFVFRRNGRVHLNRRGASVQSTAGSLGVRISGNNAGYTMFRGTVKSTGYTLHSPVSRSLPLPRVTVCLHISTGLYNRRCAWWISVCLDRHVVVCKLCLLSGVSTKCHVTEKLYKTETLDRAAEQG